MRFDERFLDEIKSRLRLSDVIGRTVKLRRQGREFAGLSPFTKEKSPSFFVNDDKGFYHCFSSGKHGDLISFLQETQRLSFPEAVEQLANEAGVPMPAIDPRAMEEEKKKQGLGDWLEAAAKWFEGELRRPGGGEARAYLSGRALPEEEWTKFAIGYAPSSRTALKDYLVTKGAMPAELVDAGLLIAPEDGGAPYDRFRNRIIFPITDARGRVVSFGGRALDAEAKAKYLNGPDSPLFDKGRTLYGLFGARKILSAAPGNEPAPLLVVEGYMDVIACHRAGVAAVAPMGTALTEGQMEILWRHHAEPTLCFDGDGAGQRAAGRVIERALPLLQPGRSFRFAMVEGGKDPDDVLREQGAAALKSQVSKTTPFVEMMFKRELEAAQPVDTPERRTALKVSLRKLAASIADKDLGQAYREDLLARYDALWGDNSKPVWQAGAASAAGRTLARSRWAGHRGRAAPVTGATNQGVAAAKALRASPRPLSAALALAALEHPGMVADKIERLSLSGFGDPQLDGLAGELVAASFEGEGHDPASLRRRLAAHGYDEGVFDRLARAAQTAKAAFLSPGLTAREAEQLWARAFDALMELGALERAVDLAKEDLARDADSATLMKLKLERDLLSRSISSGEIWKTTPSFH